MPDIEMHWMQWKCLDATRSLNGSPPRNSKRSCKKTPNKSFKHRIAVPQRQSELAFSSDISPQRPLVGVASSRAQTTIPGWRLAPPTSHSTLHPPPTNTSYWHQPGEISYKQEVKTSLPPPSLFTCWNRLKFRCMWTPYYPVVWSQRNEHRWRARQKRGKSEVGAQD